MREGLYVRVKDALEAEKELRHDGCYGCLEEYLTDFEERLKEKAELYVAPSGKVYRKKVKE